MAEMKAEAHVVGDVTERRVNEWRKYINLAVICQIVENRVFTQPNRKPIFVVVVNGRYKK